MHDTYCLGQPCLPIWRVWSKPWIYSKSFESTAQSHSHAKKFGPFSLFPSKFHWVWSWRLRSSNRAPNLWTTGQKPLKCLHQKVSKRTSEACQNRKGPDTHSKLTSARAIYRKNSQKVAGAHISIFCRYFFQWVRFQNGILSFGPSLYIYIRLKICTMYIHDHTCTYIHMANIQWTNCPLVGNHGFLENPTVFKIEII